MNNSNDPDIRAYIGATGSGKGVSIREALRRDRPKRLIIWDTLSEYSEFAKPVASLSQAIAAMSAKTFAVAFAPGGDMAAMPDKFALLCRAAFAAGDCTLLVEELADVTSPSHAPDAWRKITTQGRHRGLTVIAATQRPAHVDKHFLGGCTYLRCFTLRYEQDRKAMAGAMDVSVSEINALRTLRTPAGTEINYIERDFRIEKTTKGTIKLKNPRNGAALAAEKKQG